MFSISRLELINFKSFSGTHVLEIPEEPGLYYITGTNEDNPRLEANGIGKSTLLDAIYWCLYGTTLRGLRAADVVTRGQKGCAVVLYISVGDSDFVIRRSQSPNNLTLNDRPVDQAAIQKAIRLSPKAFTYAVMLPQFGDSFFDLKPSEKLTLFSQIMEGLDYWIERSSIASELAGEIDKVRAAVSDDVARFKGQLEGATKDIENLTVKNRSFGAQLAQAAQIAAYNKLEHAKKLHVVTESHTSATKALEGANARLAQAEKKVASLDGKYEEMLASFSALESVNAICPTCQQEVDEAHLKTTKSRLRKALDEIEAQLVAATKDQHTIWQNSIDFKREEANLRRQIEALKAKNVEPPKPQPNPYPELIAEKQRQVTKHTATIKKLEGQVEELNKEYEAVNFWVTGFKRTRLFLIEETLTQLEIEANNSLAALGLPDWRIEFDVERENKSGGITKGFTVLVYEPKWPEPIKWEAWSGGETQRLRLAGDFGLANLIMEQAGLQSTIEFYDEPSEHMNPMGLLDLAEALHHRAVSTGKRIFLVEHHTVNFGDFAGTLSVTKTAKGSSLSWA